ncbi:MAG TPA: ABC transporter substrate-binding protein [Burkholderiaceae bacterium]|nr:ABC transporter substrate-binding protein [Burkholderiaceae bacterium]
MKRHFVNRFFRALALTSVLLAQAVMATEGVTDNEIRLGASVVLTGPLGPQTREFGIGAQMYFNALNAAGGVNGRKIVYKTVDDGFDVKRTVENTQKLLNEDKVFAIFYNSGTAQTAAILPLASAANRVVFGPMTGATQLRNNFNRHLFLVRASYGDEAVRIARQLKQIGLTRVATFYEDTGLGKALMAEMRPAAAAEGLTLQEVKLDPAKPDFAAAAKSLTAGQPQVVVMCTAGLTFTNVVKALHDTGARMPIYGFSVANADVLVKVLGPQARGVVVAQIMPSLWNLSTPVVKEFLQLMKKNGDTGRPSLARFEGYIHAKLFTEGLRRAGRDLTTDSLIRALETGGEIQYGRFSARYSPHSHKGSSYVELAIIDSEGKLRY